MFSTKMEFLLLLSGYLIAIIVGLYAAVIFWKMVKDKINLQYLISEKNGQASLSRFQFLIFTFVIAISFFLAVLANIKCSVAPILPNVPPGVWALLGISGGSYVVSKGIQKETSKNDSAEAKKGGWKTDT